MPNQSLSTVQKNLVNETVRPAIESLIAMRYKLAAIVDELDNQQDPIASTADILNDDPQADQPRDNAPNLTGQNITQLRNFSANMRDQIDGVALAALIQLAVRDVPTITRIDL